MEKINWDAFAQLFAPTSEKYSVQGVFGQVVAEGKLAEMVLAYALLPPEGRYDRNIQTENKRWFEPHIMSLYERPDFPLSK